MKANYHTHNYRCKHAEGTVEDYIIAAIDAGLDEVGISDHLPHPGKNIDNKSRMSYEEIPEYFNEINKAIEKYSDKISIKKAIECEYFEDLKWFYEELKNEYKVDYFILGVHFFKYKGDWLYIGHAESTPEFLEVYTDFVVESMKSGLFAYIAHPDLFGLSYTDWDEHAIKASRKILKTAEELGMPIEININGMRKPKVKYNGGERYKYPIKEFWELSKEYDVKRIVGIDAHNPCEMADLEMGLEFARELGVETIDKLEL